MKRYLIVNATLDGLGVQQLSVVYERDTREEAVKAARDLAPGHYSLLSVIRDNFEVRPSQRVVQQVVDWGMTKQPRKRKAGASATKAPKAKKPAKRSSGSVAVVENEDGTSEVQHVN